MSESVLGALLGAAAGGLASWVLTVWQLGRQRSERVKDAQLDLVRRIAREKSGGPELAAALNEVPVIFSGDEEALSRYKSAVPDGDRADMEQVFGLFEYLARSIGLPVEDSSLLRKGFGA